MNKKLNKKLLNLIALCSGITATVTLGIGGVIYSLRQEKSGGDEPVDQNILPDSVYIIENNVLMGFTKEFLDNPTAYDMCDTMQIPARVTEIASDAFYANSTSTIPPFIKNLTFAEGSNCSSISNRSFFHSSLTSVSLPNGLTTIGGSAFGSSLLTSIDFSKATNLSSISGYAFSYCSSLTSVDLSKCSNLTSMDWYTFYMCTSLNSVKIPNSLTEIPAEAFGYCSSLTSIDFSNATNLSIINCCAFESCTSLTSVSLPESLNEIGHTAFWSCSSLRSINFPRNLTLIDNAAFTNCSALTSISLPSNLSTLGYSVFSNCSNLSSITWDAWKGNISFTDETYPPFANVSSKGTVTVTNPSGYGDIDLLQYLVENAGLPESWLPAPELPDDVYIIENNVLKGFTSEFLANPSAYKLCNTMRIPATVRWIYDEAFYANYSSTIPSFIKNLTFAENSNCSAIGSYAFGYSSLTSVDLSNSKSYGMYDGVFINCSSLTSVILPSSLGLIGSDAFYGCRSLTSVDFSNATILSSINSSAFYNCSSLTSVDLSNTSLSIIENGAFWGCSKLDTIIFPNTLTSIERSAFIYCSLLASIDLSNCVDLTTISYDSFNYCSSLTSVSFPNNLTVIQGGAFAHCSNLSTINFPSSLSTIGDDAFKDDSNLSSITWNAWNGNTSLQTTSFSGVCPEGGTVTVTNPSGHESDELLQYLLDNGGLPETWAKSVGPELPDSVYDIDENNVLKGFKAGINLSQYDGICNTIQIPARVTNIDHNAFYKNSTTTIPPFIKNLTFAEGSNCSIIGNSAFRNCSSLTSVDFLNCHNLSYCYPAVFSNCSSLTSVDFLNCTNLSGLSSSVFQDCTSLTSVSFPSKLSDFGAAVFSNCPNLSSITWNAWSGETAIGSKVFSGISSTGTIVVTNPIDDEHDASALLEYLQTVASTSEFPKTGWRAVLPESVYDINDDGVLKGFKKRIHL